MIVILGLVILIAAVIVGVAGVFANGGSNHALTDFAVFGYHVTGSTGVLFLYGIVVGAIGLAGLAILLAGTRRTARRGAAARRELEIARNNPSPADRVGGDRARVQQPPAPPIVTPEDPSPTGADGRQEVGDGPIRRRPELGRLFGYKSSGPR
ncbi:hypothetical protein ACWDUL_01130 [Nocardia niigatensis]|uniref:hypothetical protein n=1 Tax=Nocardia niigatensis TaxID=209249 RepID=UPI000304EC8D|nr:hypothetical protein [Nocardia niigatensis]